MIDDLLAAHADRLRALDPLPPATYPLPAPEPGDVPIEVDGGCGLALRMRTDLDLLVAAWTAADQYRLVPRVGGADPVGAMDDAVDLFLTEVRWGAQFGGPGERASTARAARELYREMLAPTEPWMWLAESAGRTVGLVTVTPPAHAGVAASVTAPGDVAYLGCAAVVSDRRGTGVGAAPVRHAHAALDRTGVDFTVLQYSPLNPLSAPFWHRCGYRPLWTRWDAEPASRLRRAGP